MATPGKSRLRMVGRVTFLVIFGSAVLLAGASFLLTRTELGQDLVLRQALDRIAGAVHGEVRVRLVRSRQLLLGGTFVDVAITDALGRPFLVADSVDVSYSIPRILAGDIRLTRIVLHQPHLTLEKLPGQESFNVTRIFTGGGEGPEAPSIGEAVPGTDAPVVDTTAAPQSASNRQVVFRRVEFRDGTVDVVVPLAPGAPAPQRGLVESPPGVDGRVRRFTFQQVNGAFDEMRLVDPAFPGPLFVVDSLSTVATVLDDPFVLERFTGTVAWQEDGIHVQADPLFLPGTEASVTALVELTEGGPVVRADVDAWILALADLRWAVPLLPEEAVGSANLTMEMRPGVTEVGFSDADMMMGDGRLRGSGRVVASDVVRFEGVALELEDLEVARLQRYLPDTLAIDGLLTGSVRVAGPSTGPWVQAQVTLDQSAQGRGPTVADVTGIVHLDGSLGVSDFEVELAPAQLDLFTDVVPRLGIRGPGSLRLQAAGRMAEGIRIEASLDHRPVDLPPSQVHASGTVTWTDDDVLLALSADLQPLSFTAWRVYSPELPVSGDVRGNVRADGPLGRLRVVSDLETVAGSLSLDATFDARDPLASYELAGRLSDFRASELLPELPEPSTVTGSFEARGSGADPATAAGTAQVSVWGSRLGKLDVDTAAAELRLGAGFLHIDTLTARTSVMDLGASGTLALADSLGTGQVTVDFRSASLEGIRPYLMGDSLIARDTLLALEQESLRLEGVEPDTLPELADILVDGTAIGQATLTGSVRAFDIEGDAILDNIQYGRSSIEHLEATFAATPLPEENRTISLTLVGDSLDWNDKSFLGARLEGEATASGGRVVAAVRRSEAEEYNGRATFETDSTATLVNLDELTLRFGDRRWNLGGPARVTWGDDLFSVRDFRLRRPDGEGLDLSVEGGIAFGRSSDLVVQARNVPIAQVAQVLQLDNDALFGGLVDLDVTVGGTTAEPLLTANLSGRDVGYQSIRLDRVDGRMDYGKRMMETRWTASTGDRSVLDAGGTIPIDLALDAESRIPDEPIELSVAVDSFPAGLVMGLIESLEEVEGTLTGRFEVAGTVTAPAPSGTFSLAAGSALIPDLGVRHTGVQADFLLFPDGTVEVDGTLGSVGALAVTGSVKLDTLSNPLLDLVAAGSGFLAADRADVRATVGGGVTIEGRYHRPLVRGNLMVESGALFLDEVARTAEVVDLTDPLFLNVVDTTLIASQPLLAVGENPFLRNLRLDVDMSLSRNFWLRSVDMNVEIEGELQVLWDRNSRDMAMLGELRAVRGTYSRFGRQFQVQQGTVRFIGTPGLDPDLNILAVNRLRVRDGEPLNIFAQLEGTLLSPRVSLSSDAQPAIDQSELVSYLIFGRPTYELASAEFNLVQGQFGGLFGSAAGAGATLAFGALGTQIGAAVAQEIGLDYFAISQSQGTTAFGTGLEGALRATQVEVGWYVAQDLFLALLLRPLLGINSAGISGARLEWRATDLWTVEGFLEDQFARELNTGFSINEAFQVPKVWGLFLAREWGY